LNETVEDGKEARRANENKWNMDGACVWEE
jgi:hypothetical protein